MCKSRISLSDMQETHISDYGFIYFAVKLVTWRFVYFDRTSDRIIGPVMEWRHIFRAICGIGKVVGLGLVAGPTLIVNPTYTSHHYVYSLTTTRMVGHEVRTHISVSRVTVWHHEAKTEHFVSIPNSHDKTKVMTDTGFQLRTKINGQRLSRRSGELKVHGLSNL